MVNRIDRAKQFLPFSSLAPLQQALREKEKVCVQKLELSEEMIIDISNTLQLVSKDTTVSMKYYYNRQYLKISGKVEMIDYTKKYLVVDSSKIYFVNILDISIL